MGVEPPRGPVLLGNQAFVLVRDLPVADVGQDCHLIFGVGHAYAQTGSLSRHIVEKIGSLRDR